MHRIFRVKAYEAEHGPHFNEEHARKAVSKMENEDGTRGPHWSIEETTTLQNAITGGFNALMADNASKFNIVGAKIDAQTQMINDKFCQLEMREMQNKIDALREDKQALQLSASQQAQTANIVNQIRPCPVPAYLTCNPFGCQGGLNDYGYGYGYGYNNGCGCGC
jgi:hypothetical protein